MNVYYHLCGILRINAFASTWESSASKYRLHFQQRYNSSLQPAPVTWFSASRGHRNTTYLLRSYSMGWGVYAFLFCLRGEIFFPFLEIYSKAFFSLIILMTTVDHGLEDSSAPSSIFAGPEECLFRVWVWLCLKCCATSPTQEKSLDKLWWEYVVTPLWYSTKLAYSPVERERGRANARLRLSCMKWDTYSYE